MRCNVLVMFWNRLFHLVLGVTIVPVISTLSVEAARKIGIYDDPVGFLMETLELIGSIQHQPWYPYVLGLAVGLVVREYIEFLSRRRLNRSNAEIVSLGDRCVDMADRLHDAFRYGLEPGFASLLSEFDMLAEDLEALRLGISIRRVPGQNVEQSLKTSIGILERLGPYLQSNRLREVRNLVRSKKPLDRKDTRT